MNFRRVFPAAISSLALTATLAPSLAQNPPVGPNSPGVYSMAPIPDGSTNGQLIVPLGPETPGPAVLSAANHAIFTQAQDAADHGDWLAARGLAAQGTDALAKDLVTWRYVLSDSSGATFDEIDAFQRAHPKWPRHDTMLVNAERVMPGGMDPRQVIAWFGNRSPLTGLGGMRLGEAQIALGNKEAGSAQIRKSWIAGAFTATDEAQILATHGDVITSTEHRARLERLLWASDRDAARREAARSDAGGQQLAQTRIQLATNASAVQRVVGNMPDAVRSNPAVQFDMARAYRLSGADQDAWAAMLAAPAASNPGQWWSERHIMARDAIKAGQMSLAYALAASHGLTSGSDFADAEFLSGWIALRFLKDPQKALPHFQALSRGVSFPISVARAYYWLGRTQEALNDVGAAYAAYRKAADHPETYYGQLALAHIDDKALLRLATSDSDTSSVRTTMEADDRVRAIRILADLGEKYLLRIFGLDMARDLKEPKQYRMLADIADSVGDRSLALKIAKQASYDNVFLMNYLNPIIPVPTVPAAAPPDQALVLGLTRQESEFDSEATSSAGALGLMQLMPASAKRTATAHGLRYNAKDLTADPQYNMKLGQAELADRLSDWGGSFILAIASYNAGPGNVRKWIDTYGDPRNSGVDPVDWVELIPFGETRNYVQRVLENTQVYRSRLAGNDARLAILTDLYRPSAAPSAVLVLPAALKVTPAPAGKDVPVPVERPMERDARR